MEHFRPKKESKEIDGTVRDGYWWLAFDYTNFRLCGNVGNRKKGGLFPLNDQSCLSSFDNPREESEEPCLLDPTNSYDVELIAFDEEGKAFPEPACSDWEKFRVEQTIERLKLNEHNNLAEERRKIWQRVTFEIDEFLAARSRYSPGNPVVKEKLEAHGKRIRELSRESSELSAVAKCCALFSNDRHVAKLVAP